MLRRKIQVALGDLRAFFRGIGHKLPEAANARVLQCKIFGMHQRHLEKHPAYQGKLMVPPSGEAVCHQLLRSAIADESLVAAVKGVAC